MYSLFSSLILQTKLDLVVYETFFLSIQIQLTCFYNQGYLLGMTLILAIRNKCSPQYSGIHCLWS